MSTALSRELIQLLDRREPQFFDSLVRPRTAKTPPLYMPTSHSRRLPRSGLNPLPIKPRNEHGNQPAWPNYSMSVVGHEPTSSAIRV